jgi:hypothetical protein
MTESETGSEVFEHAPAVREFALGQRRADSG